MKKLVFVALIALLFYTRFVNLGWGLPYPMHPDERNMAVAVQSLSCNFKSQISGFKFQECLNPHFYAYGQLPLYLSYGGIQLYHFAIGLAGQPSFVEATLALRTVSALSSVLLVFVLFHVIKLIHPLKKVLSFKFQVISLLILIFQPYAIQFAHFGTTESLLMLFYVIIIYLSLRLWAGRRPAPTVLFLGIVSGLALGTKTSSVLFLGIPILVIVIKFTESTINMNSKERFKLPRRLGFGRFKELLRNINGDKIFRVIITLLIYLSLTSLFFILSSPQSLLNWPAFLASMNYESAIGLGTIIPFYTRQFIGTTPLLFQFQNILPYALGWPTFIGGALGFFLLPSSVERIVLLQLAKLKRYDWSEPETHEQTAASRLRRFVNSFRKQQIVQKSSSLYLDILRFSLLFSLLPSFFFAKWTRFIAPSFPLFSLFALMFLLQMMQRSTKNIKVVIVITAITFISIIPGSAFLSIYSSPDVRLAASQWMYANIPSGSRILSETANVVDIPLPPPDFSRNIPQYFVESFDFYNLDSSPELQKKLNELLKQTDYIIIPSRRIFKNHDNASYPLLAAYYRNLFSGSGGFEKVAEFSSYPKLAFMPSFPDENAEETWTVFDHPVIRIYKKIQNSPQSENHKESEQLDFSSYTTIDYRLTTNDYHLLVADTPEKWERGLMYVTTKQDIHGLDGMIFTFPESGIRTFWNKNTLSHLTLYWIENKRVVGISDLPSIGETQVITTVSSPAPADTVIEILKD